MNGQLSNGPSYVFKSSETQLRMVLDMEKDGDVILAKEVCFADGNHKRCPGYITLTLWVRWSIFCNIIYCITIIIKKVILIVYIQLISITVVLPKA